MDIFREYNKDTIASIVNAQTSEDGVVNIEKVLEKIALFFPAAAPLVTADDLVGQDAEAFITIAVDEVFSQKAEELDEKAKGEGRPMMSLARSGNYINLVTIDNAWSDHLQNMEDLKESVILRKYQNLDPVAEYREEAYSLFQGLEDKMRNNSVFSLWQSLK